MSLNYQRAALCVGRVDGGCPAVCPALDSLQGDESEGEAWLAQPPDVRRTQGAVAFSLTGMRHPGEIAAGNLPATKALLEAGFAGECGQPVIVPRFSLKVLGLSIRWGEKTVCQNEALPASVRKARTGAVRNLRPRS